MTTSALLHFIEHALEEQAPRLEDSFPHCFDWQRLCEDAPAMAEQMSAGSDDEFDATDSILAHRLQDEADAMFRTAHTVGLAVMCAADDRTADPEDAMERFGHLPEDEVEEHFEQLVVEVLGPAEAFFADPEVVLDERAVEVHRLHALAWPHVAEYIARLDVLFEVQDEEEAGKPLLPESTHGVLMALARVAVLLAALRWMADGHPA